MTRNYGALIRLARFKVEELQKQMATLDLARADLQRQVDQLAASVPEEQVAANASKEGFDRSKLRVFYPYLGWNDIQKGLDALIASGRAEQSITHINGRPVEMFTWKAV